MATQRQTVKAQIRRCIGRLTAGDVAVSVGWCVSLEEETLYGRVSETYWFPSFLLAVRALPYLWRQGT